MFGVLYVRIRRITYPTPILKMFRLAVKKERLGIKIYIYTTTRKQKKEKKKEEGAYKDIFKNPNTGHFSKTGFTTFGLHAPMTLVYDSLPARVSDIVILITRKKRLKKN